MLEQVKKRKIKMTEKKRDMIFYCTLMAFPVIQFIIFYIVVNANSILLAFQKHDLITGQVTWTGENMLGAIKMVFGNNQYLIYAKNSLVSYLLISGLSIPLGLTFSYYIYKKLPCSGAFRVILFLPSIISSVVMATVFQFFVQRALPAYMQLFGVEMKGLLSQESTRYGTIIFYNIWIGFGTSVLMYSNSMSGIDPEIVESAHLDGASGLKEFWYISLPMVYPTLSTFIIFGVAKIFVDQIQLYSLYAGGAPEKIKTFGYFLFDEVAGAKSKAEYPILSAIGIILTAISVPVTFAVKHLLEKHGPSEN